ncbi:MAG: zinc ABC transporter substrate-binding protein [Ruminococcus sp.]|nr:zinc ABC transporter substrate-binding protein [Ruminococcus sp.]
MKRLLSLLLAVLVMLSLSACSKSIQKDIQKLNIVATIFPQFDFARELAGDKAEVTMLLPPGGESHSFEPTVSDIIAINNCDIFIYTGGESDTWINSLLETSENKNMTVISLMSCVDIHNFDDSHEHKNEHNHNHSHIDEHVWTSPVNAVSICEKICDELIKKDPDNADFYKNNFENYKEELLTLDTEFRTITKNSLHKTFIFADRFPLKYFAEEYGLSYHAAFSGCSEDTEPSAHIVAELIDEVKEENISAILKIELSSDSIGKTICKETGAELLTFYSCHNISKEDFEKGETYLSLMQKNTDTLKIALN